MVFVYSSTQKNCKFSGKNHYGSTVTFEEGLCKNCNMKQTENEIVVPRLSTALRQWRFSFQSEFFICFCRLKIIFKSQMCTCELRSFQGIVHLASIKTGLLNDLESAYFSICRCTYLCVPADVYKYELTVRTQGEKFPSVCGPVFRHTGIAMGSCGTISPGNSCLSQGSWQPD